MTKGSEYRSPLANPTHLRSRQTNNVTHGRYKDIFDLNALEKKQQREKNNGCGTRPMRMSPDLDFRIDRLDQRKDEALAEMERRDS